MSEPWQLPRWGRVLVVVAVAVAGYSAGRFSAPAEVEERVSVATVYRDRIVEKRVEVRGRDRIVYRDSTSTPDGTVHVIEVEKTIDVERVAVATDATREGQQTIEVIKRVEVRPGWRVAVLAGASLSAPAVPIAGPLVLGVEIDRRIVGGVSAGVWANTGGAAGLAVSLEF
jgi:hypothetical protein